MKNLIFTLLILSLTSAFAQTSVIWKGGTPGRETSWNEPRNWSTYQVPDEDAHVVIQVLNTGHYAQPVIDEEVTVASVEIQAGASLTIKAGGELLVDGTYQYSQGIVNSGGSLVNEGLISLVEVEGFQLENCQISLRGEGQVLLNDMDMKTEVVAIIKE